MNSDDNPLSELSLAILDRSGLTPDLGPTGAGQVADKAQTHPDQPQNQSKIKLSFTNFLDSQDQKYRHLLAEHAWICVSCETINGVDTKGRIRKTCSKCKRLKGGSREVIEVILEEN